MRPHWATRCSRGPPGRRGTVFDRSRPAPAGSVGTRLPWALESRAVGVLAEALLLVSGTTIRTVARAPRLRSNGAGPLELWADGAGVDGDPSALVGGCVESRVAPDDWTAGNPIIVFLRGGLEEEARFISDAGGGVTTGDFWSRRLDDAPGRSRWGCSRREPPRRRGRRRGLSRCA